jgi:Leucine-rich repeat (LRR) protein
MFLFRHWVLFFSVLLILFGCQSGGNVNKSDSKTSPQNNFSFPSTGDFRKLLLENGGTIKEGYVDKYGNRYDVYAQENEYGKYFLSYSLYNIPDTTILLPLKNYIHILHIGYDSPITDIAFIENFRELTSLTIANQSILNFEPVGKLPGLRQLRINNNTIIDCSIFANLKNLEGLTFSTDRLINLEAIFDKSQEEFKLPKLNYLNIGEYGISKRKDGYFLAKVKGLTPRDKSARDRYGNSKGESYVDQYGNRYNGKSGYEISVEILHAPDLEVLSTLANNIVFLTIEDSSPITDIAFLERATILESLKVKTLSIESFEPLKYSFQLKHLELINPGLKTIESLKYLNQLATNIALSLNMDFLADNGYGNVSDFLYSISDIENIKVLNLWDSELENTDETYRVAREMFKISNLEQINFGENDFYKDTWKGYEFKSGTYRILQYRANVRAEPNRNSKSITVLNLHDEVEIVENTFVEEKINNIWGFWYKIKCGNITGYTFGGNIAYSSLVTDIDKNGINDYFYWRFSRGEYSGVINPLTDIIIYINNQRINTDVINTTEGSLLSRPYEWCILEEGDDDVLIGFVQYGRHQYEYITIFKVNPNGKIEYLQN